VLILTIKKVFYQTAASLFFPLEEDEKKKQHSSVQ
jgi:hypothetical protein